MALCQVKYLLASLKVNGSCWGKDVIREAATILRLAVLVEHRRNTIGWVWDNGDGEKETQVGTCWRWNLDKSIYKLIPRGESEEEPEGGELNICVGREGETVGETPGETTTTWELVGEKSGELATAMDDTCECGKLNLHLKNDHDKNMQIMLRELKEV